MRRPRKGWRLPPVLAMLLGLLPEWRFSRELDPATGYAELRIKAQPER